MAMKCPQRREIVNKKRKKGQESTTYNMAKRSNQQANLPETTAVSPNTHTIIYACFMYAHIVNIANPGTFQQEVNKMFKMNNLPMIKTPDNPPSQDILNVMSQQPNTNITSLAEGGLAHRVPEKRGKKLKTRR